MLNDQTVAKATNAVDRSNAVVVSFASKWFDDVTEGRVTAVIRKRIPREAAPQWLYFYFNAPRSVLAARGRITSIGQVPDQEAVSLKSSLCMSEGEILKYVGDSPNVGVYRIKSIETAQHALSLPFLRQHVVFHPPQSFFFLSKDGKNTIDQLASFSD